MFCVHCDEEIKPEERFECYANGPIAHRECFLRGVLGSVKHQEKLCSCYHTDANETDDPSLTRREAALAAVRCWEKHNGKLLL